MKRCQISLYSKSKNNELFWQLYLAPIRWFYDCTRIFGGEYNINDYHCGYTLWGANPKIGQLGSMAFREGGGARLSCIRLFIYTHEYNLDFYRWNLDCPVAFILGAGFVSHYYRYSFWDATF